MLRGVVLHPRWGRIVSALSLAFLGLWFNLGEELAPHTVKAKPALVELELDSDGQCVVEDLLTNFGLKQNRLVITDQSLSHTRLHFLNPPKRLPWTTLQAVLVAHDISVSEESHCFVGRLMRVLHNNESVILAHNQPRIVRIELAKAKRKALVWKLLRQSARLSSERNVALIQSHETDEIYIVAPERRIKAYREFAQTLVEEL